jgi:hypothetical protein
MSNQACLYCEQNTPQLDSHIIPSFIYKWIKDTSPAPYIRSTEDPNKREQDGPTQKILCHDCEQAFSIPENAFKHEIFRKFANYRNPPPDQLTIGIQSIECIYSIAWRVLAEFYYYPKDHQLTKEEFENIPKILREIKSCIDNKSFEKFNIHFIPCTNHVLSKGILPKVPHFYYDRATGADYRIYDYQNTSFIQIKIPFCIFIFEIDPVEPSAWVGTKLNPTEEFDTRKIESTPDYVRDQISIIFSQFESSRDQITPDQVEKIRISIEKGQTNSGSEKSMNKQW